MRNPKLIGKLRAALPAPARRLLDDLLRLAEPQGVSLYLVGGPLRDLLLDRPSLDIDIAVEGDAMALARGLAEATGGQVVTHPRFDTATVRLGESHVDLITARSETYARPGALPTVKPATIREDLRRRDFTINALALRLNKSERGEIIDPTAGIRDLDANLIRVLHERSFQNDATRILRAFRYAARLGFKIEPETLAWLKRDLAYLEAISGARLHREFARILGEAAPEQTLLRLHEIGALTAIHAVFHFGPEHAEAFVRLRELNSTGAGAAYWPILAWRMGSADAALLGRRLAATGQQRTAIEAIPILQRFLPNLRRQWRRSALAEMFSPFPLPALWAFAALTDDATVRDRLLEYLRKARHVRAHLTGDDLLALGVSRSPQLGEILRRLRNARLDGEVRTRADEESLVRDALASNKLTTDS